MLQAARSVVLADEDPAVLHGLSFALQLDGFRVRAYRHALELIGDRAALPVHCLILSDVFPPEGGFALLEALAGLGIEIPTILLTGRLTPAIKARARARRIHAVLEKPLLENALIEAIQTLQ
jgi:FixJ family two-component response regulator